MNQNPLPTEDEMDRVLQGILFTERGKQGLSRKGDALIRQAGGIEKAINAPYGENPELSAHLKKERKKEKEGDARNTVKKIKRAFKTHKSFKKLGIGDNKEYVARMARKKDMHAKESIESLKSVLAENKSIPEAPDYILRNRMRNGRIQEETLTESRSRKTAVNKIANMRPLKDKDKKSLKNYLRKNPGKLHSLAGKFGSTNLGRAYDDDTTESHPHKKPNGST